MTGTDERPEPDGIDYVETEETFSRYMASMCMHADNRVVRILSAGPLEVYRVRGWTAHLMVVNPHPRCDHSDLESALYERIGPAWQPFAVFYNAEEEWEVIHLEPAAEARPLQECC